MIFQYDIKDNSEDEVKLDLEIGYGHNGVTGIMIDSVQVGEQQFGDFNDFVVGKNNELKKKAMSVNTSVDLTDSGNTNAIISLKLKGGEKDIIYPNIMPIFKDEVTAHFNVIFYFY